MREVVALMAALLAVGAEAAEPMPKVPDGFKVELVLKAPDVEAPTALCVANNGDVYYAEDPMDMTGPPTQNLDRIWMLKGGDPTKKVLIADKMWSVMGLEIVGDKLFVVHAPHVTVFTLDAEGKPVERKELFDDLGPPVAGAPSFNDHIPSGIRMGMDGWLYVSIGDKGIPRMTRKEKDQGSVHVAEGRWRWTKEGNHVSLEGGGVIRFRPDGSGLEVFASGTRNHLDVPMDDQDRIFVRDNTDDGRGWWTRLMYLPERGFLGYPWAYTQRTKETLPMVRDFGGGSPCGGYVYCDDGLPETYRNRVFHCEWGKGNVTAVKLAPDGAGFKFVDEVPFMDPNGVKDFRPFTLRPTADGRGFYVTDWGYSGWLAKLKAGRLWKVTYVRDDVKPAPRGKDSDSIEQLVKSLDHPAHTERLRAQRALERKGKTAQKALEATVGGGAVSARARVHALWALRDQSTDLWWIEHTDAQRLLEDPSPLVRLQAARALDLDRIPGKIPPNQHFLLKVLDRDGDPQVRLHAVASLSRQLSILGDLKELILRLEKESDPSVRFALVSALRKGANSKPIIHAWPCNWKSLLKDLSENDDLKDMPRAVDGLCWALSDQYDVAAIGLLKKFMTYESAGSRRRAVETLARLGHDRKPYDGSWWGTQPAGRKPPDRNVAWEGTPQVRDALLAAMSDRDAGVRKAAVTGLIAMNDPTTLGPLVKQFGTEADPELKADVVRAVAALRATPESMTFLGSVLSETKNPEVLRVEALAGLETAKSPPALALVAKAAAESEPVVVQTRAVQALGVMKAPAAHPAFAAGLRSSHVPVRKAAAVALGLAITDKLAAAKLLIPALADKDATVRVAIIQALGALQVKDAIPALAQAAADDATQFEAITALTKVPDVRALPAYLTGLASKNAGLRQASQLAITAIRDLAAPALEELVKRNEVRAEVIPQLRTIYSAFAPVIAWRIIGPFPFDGKSYPPEEKQDFDAAYKGVEKEVRWKTIQADAKNHGFVNLEKVIGPGSNVIAYGYAEIESKTERAVQLLAGSDDTLTIWLNGKKVHDYPNDRGWTFDSDKVSVTLVKGTNRLLVKCGQHGGFWGFSVAAPAEVDRYAFLRGGAQKFDLETFRAFARKNKGDAARGQKLFLDQKGLACVKCHAVGGQGGQVGPDLAGIALKYQREDLMTSILEPSKTIAQGYETILITTTKGQTLQGVFKGENADAVDLADKDGKRISVPKKEIEERAFSPLSTMPNGLNEGMTLQDFADLVAYMEARREEKAPPGK